MQHKLLFVGDVVLQSEPSFSTELQALVAEQHICCCNVEAPLAGIGSPELKTGPAIQQRKEAPVWLRNLGFNLFAMANNHILDYGRDAMQETKHAFGDDVIGVGTEEQAYGLVVKTIDNTRYGFLAYAENGYGALNGDRSQGYAWVNHPRVNTDLTRYKQQVDILMVQVHAGVEMVDIPIPEWRDRYRELIDYGADIVIAHHPHVVQGQEMYKGKHIVYSLGNFYFDGILDTLAWRTGALLQVTVEQGQIQQAVLRLTLKNDTTVSLKSSEETILLLNGVNEKLRDEVSYSRDVNNIAIDQWQRHHQHYYAKPFNGLSGFSLKALAKHIKRLLFNREVDYSLLWHNMEIESNFWIARRAIRKLRRRK
ncbi:CapA family protein [Sphingobacterium paludis]|uniref:Poly-gamma-glutamate synthesis protein (Capsule biosynthesis protein) n=1 Tax=Sphingobacterium paludis TaxID=1476465 RepID=A0A4R7CS15_9SPHI|nr:CapA family protein [Sphingobacterium paludis]TDS08439.1 poly-gamma-glutamate synthesis protein (capsule biosynthesis protein) [Sphingobacterium paludis]